MINKIESWLKDNHFQMTITNNGLYIKDYNKLIEIEEDYALVKVKDKYISIIGSNLQLERILEKELLLKGSINKIEVLDD